jgi:hypothetical protein
MTFIFFKYMPDFYLQRYQSTMDFNLVTYITSYKHNENTLLLIKHIHTLILSSHKSARKTITPSSFSSSYLNRPVDDLRLICEGPPKLFTFPK